MTFVRTRFSILVETDEALQRVRAWYASFPGAIRDGVVEIVEEPVPAVIAKSPRPSR